MSESLNTRFTGQFSASLTNQLALETVNANPSLSLNTILTNGTGANQADQIWADQRTLAASGSESFSLQTFSGSLDAVGGSLNLARVKGLLIQNLGALTQNTEAGSLTIGGAGVGAWTPLTNGNSSLKIQIPGGASFTVMAPLANAWPVGSSSGSLFAVVNLNSASAIQYNIIVLGASG